MQVVEEHITLAELAKMAEKMFGSLVKAVIDTEKEIMLVDAEMHCDLEAQLLENGSQQEHLWGINIHPNKIDSDDWIEFDSMINLRPSWGNRTRSVDDPIVREKIKTIVSRLVKK